MVDLLLQFCQENGRLPNDISEDFIREFADRVDWELIYEYQSLSGEFIREFANRVDWNEFERQKLNRDFIQEFQRLYYN